MVFSDGKYHQETGYERLDDYHAVQRSTGEIVAAHQQQVIVGSLIFTPEQQEAYKKRKAREEKEAIRRTNNKGLGRYYFVNSENRYKDISPQTMARLTYLGTFLKYNSNILCNRNGLPMNKGDIESIMRLSKATFYRFWNEAFGQYLSEDSSGHICLVNDFKRGTIKKVKTHTAYQKIYIEAVRELYESVPASKHRHLGYIFQMLPYVNLEYNILSFMPDETNINAIEPMTVDEFCSLIGVVTEKRSRIIKEYSEIVLPVRGHLERFCSFVLDGLNIDRAKIFINPHIMYRGSNWERVEVLGSFMISKDIPNEDTAGK